MMDVEDIVAQVPDRRVARIETIEDAAALGDLLKQVFRLDVRRAFIVTRRLWDRRWNKQEEV